MVGGKGRKVAQLSPATSRAAGPLEDISQKFNGFSFADHAINGLSRFVPADGGRCAHAFSGVGPLVSADLGVEDLINGIGCK
jgi:hypothetical protein